MDVLVVDSRHPLFRRLDDVRENAVDFCRTLFLEMVQKALQERVALAIADADSFSPLALFFVSDGRIERRILVANADSFRGLENIFNDPLDARISENRTTLENLCAKVHEFCKRNGKYKRITYLLPESLIAGEDEKVDLPSEACMQSLLALGCFMDFIVFPDIGAQLNSL